jgi:hypothetical protein
VTVQRIDVPFNYFDIQAADCLQVETTFQEFDEGRPITKDLDGNPVGLWVYDRKRFR